MPAHKKLTPETLESVVAAVRAGAEPSVAFRAFGLSESYWKQQVFVVRHKRPGWETAQPVVDSVLQAQAQCEVNSIATTRAAERVDKVAVKCPDCGAKYEADPMHISGLLMNVEAGHRMKAAAAATALHRLERRFPKRWSQKVVHTIAEEHDRLLDVIQRLLAPEDVERILEAYLSGGEGEDEAPSAPGGSPEGGVH